MLHRSLSFTTDAGQRVLATLDIAPDHDDPHAISSIRDELTDEPTRGGKKRKPQAGHLLGVF